MKTWIFILSMAISPAFAEWNLVWSDEFDKPGLPDPDKWAYEEGFVRNREDQYYTKTRKENARVEDGCLILEARHEDINNPAFISSTHPDWQKNREKAHYTSACIVTENLASWKYGKIEIKAKLPLGKGAWPAFWMMGTNKAQIGWPRCGEIDIMEHVTSSPGVIYGTTHWFLPGKDPNHASKGFKTTNDSLGKWHTYGIIWNEKEIIYLFDNKEYGRYDLTEADNTVHGMNPFQKPFYLLINLAVGGAWGGPPDPAVFPQKLVVDYVRIYEKKK